MFVGVAGAPCIGRCSETTCVAPSRRSPQRTGWNKPGYEQLARIAAVAEDHGLAGDHAGGHHAQRDAYLFEAIALQQFAQEPLHAFAATMAPVLAPVMQ